MSECTINNQCNYSYKIMHHILITAHVQISQGAAGPHGLKTKRLKLIWFCCDSSIQLCYSNTRYNTFTDAWAISGKFCQPKIKCIHTYIHTYVHTYIYTYIHTYIIYIWYIQFSIQFNSLLKCTVPIGTRTPHGLYRLQEEIKMNST